jgi:hypothetical protein
VKVETNPVEYNTRPTSIAAGDFNNDTWLDIVVANSKTHNIDVYFDVSKVSSGFAYFLLTFAHEPVLALYLVVLRAEFNSVSNGANLTTCCSAENRSFTPNTGSKPGFSRYFLLTFAHGLVLALYLVVLGAEFDSASNGALPDTCCPAEK